MDGRTAKIWLLITTLISSAVTQEGDVEGHDREVLGPRSGHFVIFRPNSFYEFWSKLRYCANGSSQTRYAAEMQRTPSGIMTE